MGERAEGLSTTDEGGADLDWNKDIEALDEQYSPSPLEVKDKGRSEERMQVPNAKRARVMDQIPQKEVVRRYEKGGSITEIVSFLRQNGFPANWYWVDSVLDRHQVDRHPKQSSATDQCRQVVDGREVELARRILDEGEPIQTIAQELDVKHTCLAKVLKESGHLPDVNLSRLKRQMRLKGES